ncbi:MAG TPA: T9SS type A sorting domain-containing protein, partial [Bacteroidota bacterium]|nr:T9SS type A sorting domain-containing protein [Bacteroidota bacterium]
YFLDSLRGWVAGHEGTILRTTNGGRSWQTQITGITNNIQEIFMLNERLGWALAHEYFVDTSVWYGTRILTTTNGGTTWTQEQYPVWGDYFNAIFYTDSLHGWMAGEFGKLVRTTNAGLSWQPAVVDSSPYAQWTLVNVKFFSPQIGFAMGGRIDIIGVVWRTTNGGARWIPQQVSPEPVHDMQRLDSLHIVAIVGDVDYGASMIRSRDAGVTWEYTFLNIFGLPQSLSFRTRNEVWAPLGFEGRLMYSLDTAHTWTTIETPRRRPVYDLVFTDSLTGYAVGDSGIILKFKAPTVGVHEPAFGVPEGFRLYQNYPNPFNPSTTLSFDLPRASTVNLRVLNLLGQEVRTLISGRREAGRHYVPFDARDLPGGVYFVVLQADGFSAVKKMMLLR